MLTDMKAKIIKYSILLCIVCVVVLSFRSLEPSNTIVSKQCQYKEVYGISVSGGIIIDYYPIESNNNVLITGPKNVVAALKIKKDITGILHFEIPGRKKFKYTSDNQRLHIQISMPSIYQFKAMNGSSINSKNNLCNLNKIIAQAYSNSRIEFTDIQASKVRFESYTNSEITASIKSDNCEVQSYTNSIITLSGSTSHLNGIASSSIIDASKLSYERISRTLIDSDKFIHDSSTIHN